MFKYYSDKRVIEGIKKGELKTYEYLYKRYYKQVVKYVRYNKSVNYVEDGNDLYQDTIVELIRVVKGGRYREEWKFGPTFEMIYKRRWLKVLDKRRKKPISDIEKLKNHIIEDTTYGEISDIYNYIKRLSLECQEIFSYEKRGYNLEEIAKKRKIKPPTIRKQKSRCIQKLRELMEKDGLI